MHCISIGIDLGQGIYNVENNLDTRENQGQKNESARIKKATNHDRVMHKKHKQTKYEGFEDLLIIIDQIKRIFKIMHD